MNSKQSYTFDNPFIGGKNILIPRSLKWLASFSFKRFAKKHAQENVDFGKAESLLTSLLSRNTQNTETQQQPTHALCASLLAQPFWEAKDDPLLANIQETLETNCAQIANEYRQALISESDTLAQTINTGKGFLEENSWLNVRLGTLSNYSERTQKLFPHTVSVLAPLGKRVFSAEFIIMEADTCLPPHTDATNAYLVCHLGLQVPDNCGLQVKDKIREFHQGDVIFFDQSFIHSAWNKGETTRVNLLLTIFHPEINDAETELILKFIKSLQIKALLFSPIILTEYMCLKTLSFFKK
jgi:aspartate beta-hydroxylase